MLKRFCEKYINVNNVFYIYGLKFSAHITDLVVNNSDKVVNWIY